LTGGVFSSVGQFAGVAGVGARLGQNCYFEWCLLVWWLVDCGCWNSGVRQGIIGLRVGCGAVVIGSRGCHGCQVQAKRSFLLLV